jgi:phenylpropionate dioxygenase-like ring-hydroxylating dioxygenase large terminal subunit
MRWYLDLMFQRTPGGVEVLGPPQRIRIKANWKIGVENFGGDGYHFNQAHQSELQVGAVPSFPEFPWYGVSVYTKESHMLGINQVPPEIPFPPYNGIPPELVELVEQTLTKEQLNVFKNTANIHGSVFPSMSFLYSAMLTDRDMAPAPFVLARTWVPLAAGETEVITWNFTDVEAPEWLREASRKTYLRSFGTSGTFEQDDFEIFPLINERVSTPIGRKQVMNYGMGLNKTPIADWPGPGTVFQDDCTEANQREFYRRWATQLQNGNIDAAPAE